MFFFVFFIILLFFKNSILFLFYFFFTITSPGIFMKVMTAFFKRLQTYVLSNKLAKYERFSVLLSSSKVELCDILFFILFIYLCIQFHHNNNNNPSQKTGPYNNQQKKRRICKIVDFAVRADHRINLKESEKMDKYLDLARELKKLWNMKLTIVPIVIGALGTISKGLLKGLEDLEVGGRVETIQTTASLRTARILRRVLEIWGDLLSLKLQWTTIS